MALFVFTVYSTHCAYTRPVSRARLERTINDTNHSVYHRIISRNAVVCHTVITVHN